MKIEKAIEILEENARDGTVPLADFQEAQKLGIEALTCIKEHRAEFGNIPYTSLPSETE